MNDVRKRITDLTYETILQARKFVHFMATEADPPQHHDLREEIIRRLNRKEGWTEEELIECGLVAPADGQAQPPRAPETDARGWTREQLIHEGKKKGLSEADLIERGLIDARKEPVAPNTSKPRARAAGRR